MRSFALVVVALALLGGCEGGDGEPPAKADKPARVERSAEGGAATLSLSAQAVERLGLELGDIEARSLPRTRTYGGVLMLPPDAQVVVTAPVSGTLRAAGEASLPGAHVTRGAKVFELEPLLSPERAVLTPSERVQLARTEADLALQRAQADGALQTAEARAEAAGIARERAERMLRDGAGSVRMRDEALAADELARAELGAARALHEVLSSIELDGDAGDSVPLDLVAPIDGRVTVVSAAPGQLVAAGAALFQVARFAPLWVRVPVYAGELDAVDAAAEALVGSLDGRLDGDEPRAQPLDAPPTADPLGATVDLYYVLDAPRASSAPGARVGVTLALKTRGEALVAPFDALLFDVQGDAWVYVALGSLAYRRERVELARVVGTEAVLARGPAPGTQVVTKGAAELYGTEFGTGK